MSPVVVRESLSCPVWAAQWQTGQGRSVANVAHGRRSANVVFGPRSPTVDSGRQWPDASGVMVWVQPVQLRLRQTLSAHVGNVGPQMSVLQVSTGNTNDVWRRSRCFKLSASEPDCPQLLSTAYEMQFFRAALGVRHPLCLEGKTTPKLVRGPLSYRDFVIRLRHLYQAPMVRGVPKRRFS